MKKRKGRDKPPAQAIGLGRIVALYYLLIPFIPESLKYSVPLFLKQQCDRTLASDSRINAAALFGSSPRYCSICPLHVPCAALPPLSAPRALPLPLLPSAAARRAPAKRLRDRGVEVGGRRGRRGPRVQRPRRRREVGQLDCPGRKPPFLHVKRPARPCKTAIQKRFTVKNAKGA
jgi:hypothetical protein